MAKGRAIGAILLLTLPIAAPAVNTRTLSVAAADDIPVSYLARPGETLRAIAERGLVRPDDLAALAAANRIRPSARLRAGDHLIIPATMLRREPVGLRVLGFAGEARLATGAPLAVGMAVQEGDELVTGPESTIRLGFDDGRRVLVPSQSRLAIEALHHVPLTGRTEERLVLRPAETDWATQLGLGGAREQLLTPTRSAGPVAAAGREGGSAAAL